MAATDIRKRLRVVVSIMRITWSPAFLRRIDAARIELK